MKRIGIAVLTATLAVGGCVQQALAQEQTVGFSLNPGVMTDLGRWSSFSDVLFTLTPRIDQFVTENFAISADAMFVTNKRFELNPLLIYPGLTLNAVFGRFFIGAGAALPMAIRDGDVTSGDILPRLNLGYRFKHLQITANLLTGRENLFEWNLVGLSLGYVF